MPNRDLMVRPKAADYIRRNFNGPLHVEIVRNATHAFPISQPSRVLQLVDKYKTF